MLELKEVIVKNVVSYKSAKLPITKNCGLIIMGGDNQDSIDPNFQSNGAGKTLLWSAIPNCVYSAAPSSSSKNSKKDMLDSAKSYIELRFIDNTGRKIQLIQTSKKWIFKENGEDQKVLRVNAQAAKIKEYWPITADEFYAYCYLTSIPGQRVHFQVDKPTERLKFITDIFKLDDYDRLKAYFTKSLSKIKDDQIRYDVINSKLLNTNTQLERLAWNKKARENHKEMVVEFEAVTVERDLIVDKVRTIAELVRKIGSIDKLVVQRNSLLKDFVSLEGKDLDNHSSKLRKRRDVLRTYQKYLDEMRSYKKNTKRIKSKIVELDVKVSESSGKDLEEEFGAVKKKRAKLKDKINSMSELMSDMSRLDKRSSSAKSVLKDLGFKSVKKVDMDSNVKEDLAICRTTLKLKKLLDSGNSACPTCLQDVDMDSISESVQKAKKRIKKYERLLEARDAVGIITKCTEELALLKPTSSSKEELESKYDVLSDRLESIKALHALHEKLADLKEDLSDIDKPKKPSNKPKDDTNEDSISEILEACRSLEKVNSNIAAIVGESSEMSDIMDSDISDHKANLESKLAELSKKKTKLDVRYKELMSATSKCDLKQGEFNILNKQRKEQEGDLEDLSPLLEQRDIYKALEKAYSAKGLKINKANDIVKLLEANLNRYSNLIFAEAFKFSVYVTESGVFCDVDRGKGKTPTDVRLLSGAEADCFRLLFMLSLLLMVPSERRTNFVILDEPDSHMDNKTRLLMIDRYIPFLREVVPHVIVITPNDKDLYTNCDFWTAVKKDGISRLEKN
jgi:DNA repair exonuclease SbcCD ATPase subunit